MVAASIEAIYLLAGIARRNNKANFPNNYGLGKNGGSANQ
jgi:hypothetical protein